MLDILIRGGTVIDGTGRPARRADVAIAGDRIEAIDLFPGAGAARVIDAAGQVVAPGFIDMHSHADFVLPGLPTADSKVHQGFTLEVVGNCGASPAPLTPARRQDVIESSGLTLPALAWDWTTFRSYLDGLSRQGLSINVAPLVGHGTVRLVVMGSGDAPPDGRSGPGHGARGPARDGRRGHRLLHRSDLRARRVRRHRRARRPDPSGRGGGGLLREPHPGRERHAPAGDRRGDRGRAPGVRPGRGQPPEGRGPVELAEDGRRRSS